MSKVNFEDYLSDYIDGNMKDNEREEFELILSNDKDLRNRIEELKAMLLEIKGIDKVNLPSGFDIKLKESIDNYNNSKSRGFNIFKLFDNPVYAGIGAVAAIILITITTTLSIITPDSNDISNLAENSDNIDMYNNENDSNDFEIQRVDFESDDIKYEDY